MMDYTDRHFRYLLRLISPSAFLYTEMINAHAVIHGDHARWLTFDALEHPVALQLGGNEPRTLADAARIGESYGYDEINLNCGCPSDRVLSGRFGACLMAEPQRVADCVAAMRASVRVPVTVKCRIGIEPCDIQDEYEFLRMFVASVVAAGCDALILHARKAILTGLSPKANREIPPLRFDFAARLRREFPRITLVVNGGIRDATQVKQYLRDFDGVMIGREVCQNPYWLAELHRMVYDERWTPPTRESVTARYVSYLHERSREGAPLAPMLRRALSLYAGVPGARAWRRFISERAALASATPDLLHDSLRIVGGAAV